MMRGEHVKGRKEGCETVRCCCKCKVSCEAIMLIYFFLIITSHCIHTLTPPRHTCLPAQRASHRLHLKPERVSNNWYLQCSALLEAFTLCSLTCPFSPLDKLYQLDVSRNGWSGKMKGLENSWLSLMRVDS